MQIFFFSFWLNDSGLCRTSRSVIQTLQTEVNHLNISGAVLSEKPPSKPSFLSKTCLCTQSNWRSDDIFNAMESRKNWMQDLFSLIDGDLDRYFRIGENILNSHSTNDRHSRFDFLGPVSPQCEKMEVFGSGDGEKRACGLKKVLVNASSCTIISLGSNNQWDFEEAVFREVPRCQIHTFDCTMPIGSKAPDHISARTVLHPICLGSSDERKNGLQFLSWKSMIKLINITEAPLYLKMDIEGYEYEVLINMLKEKYLPPVQIALELHYNTNVPVTWQQRGRTSLELALFMQRLYEQGGYFLIDRHDNPFCPHCSEILICRLICPCDDSHS
jgi:hypothetical protein